MAHLHPTCCLESTFYLLLFSSTCHGIRSINLPTSLGNPQFVFQYKRWHHRPVEILARMRYDVTVVGQFFFKANSELSNYQKNRLMSSIIHYEVSTDPTDAFTLYAGSLQQI